MKIKFLAIVASILALMLCSCLGIDLTGNIKNNGQIDITTVYTVDNAVDELGKLGSNANYMPVPISQNDIELAARRAGGKLNSYNRKNNENNFTITAKLSFDSLEAFAKFLDPEGKVAIASNNSLKLVFDFSDTEQDQNLLDFMKIAFSDYIISFSFNLPVEPKSVEGFLVDGKKISFSEKAFTLYSTKESVIISFTM